MVVIIGGTGLLGTEIYKIIGDKSIKLDSSYDLFTFTRLRRFLDKKNPEVIINCAAIKSEKVDENPIEAINLNIIGTSNLSKYCIEKNKRLVFISTDYVYPGKRGNYKESDYLSPKNNYAWTKLAGESSVKLVKNHLIIRTSFGTTKFPYKKAYKNLYTSKDYVDIIAPLIVKCSTSTTIGTINIGTSRKSMYDYAFARNLNVESADLPETLDFSLNLQKLDEL